MPGRWTEPLSREEVAAAALAIVDAEGVEALSMRRLGAALSVSATALYRHFRDKDEVLREVSQHLLAGMRVGDAAAVGPSEWLKSLGREYGRVLFAHPNVVPVLLSFKTRARTLPVTDHILGQLSNHGIHPTAGVAILDTVESYCLGFGLTATRPDTWRQPPADEIDRLPHLARAHAGTRASVSDEFAAGLDILVDGLIARHAPTPATSR